MADGKPQAEEGGHCGEACSDVEEKALEVKVADDRFFCVWPVHVVFGGWDESAHV